MRNRVLALAALAELGEPLPAPEAAIPEPRPKTGYQPGDFRWRKVKGSYSRTLAARLAARQVHRKGNG